MIRKSFIDESRKDYGRDVPANGGIETADLMAGCQMRIAKALERIADRLDADRVDARNSQLTIRRLRTQIRNLKAVKP